MSRLSEILGVPEGREFKFKDKVYVIRGNHIAVTFLRYTSQNVETNVLCDMIAHSELIYLIPEKSTLTDQQITAIKGRIAEGTPWAARDCAVRNSSEDTYFYSNKPKLDKTEGYFHNDNKNWGKSYSDIYSFITYENSPVYLPDLIEGSEEE